MVFAENRASGSLNIFLRFFVFSTATTKHLVYFSLDYRGEVQELTFDHSQVHRLFYGSFHKVRYTEQVLKDKKSVTVIVQKVNV